MPETESLDYRRKQQVESCIHFGFFGTSDAMNPSQGESIVPEIPEFDAVDAILKAAAREIVLPQFRNLADSDVRTKSGPNDFVTVADEQCEVFLSDALTAALPGSVVIGEEAAAADPGVLDRLDQPGDVWIIDPIDGTYNYAHDDPRFATIVALVRDGRVVRGYFHVPVTGETYTAAPGEGATCEGRQLALSEPKPFGAMTGVLYVGKSRTPALYDRIKAMREGLGPRRFDRCAAFEYIALLTGKAHYALFTRMMPWDHAAGVLMVSEAGGCYGYFDEGPRNGPWQPEIRDAPFLLSPDSESWSLIHEKLILTDSY